MVFSSSLMEWDSSPQLPRRLRALAWQRRRLAHEHACSFMFF
jgi:hypothetical protein